MGNVNYFGVDGLHLQSGGEITTARNGLATGRITWLVKPMMWNLMPNIGAVHPYATFCVCEKRNVKFTKGFWTVLCDYVGAEYPETTPVYEWNPGVGNEPIQTIDNFVSQIAGTPSAPLNGAIWRSQKTGLVTTSNDVNDSYFDRFSVWNPDMTKNPWGAVSEYLAASNSVYTKSWVRRSKPVDADRPLTVISTPPGDPPVFGANHNWLQFPVSYTKRGLVFDCRQQFLLSTRTGWNHVIYNGGSVP